LAWELVADVLWLSASDTKWCSADEMGGCVIGQVRRGMPEEWMAQGVVLLGFIVRRLIRLITRRGFDQRGVVAIGVVVMNARSLIT
jgi:hypothetical protein